MQMTLEESAVTDTTKGDLEEMIKGAEKVRERGRTNLAIVLFEDVINESKKLGWPDIQASALGHLIVCYKHLYQKSGNTVHVKQMIELCKRGMILDVPEGTKSVFALRKGDCYGIFGEFDLAANEYRKAIKMAAGNSALIAEYQGHQADNLIDKGSPEEALNRLKSADLTLYFESDSLRLFHYRTIKAGFRYKMAKAAYRIGKYGSAVLYGVQGFWLALVLAIRHLKPARLMQIFQFMMGRSI